MTPTLEVSQRFCIHCRFWKRWSKPNPHVDHEHGDCQVRLPPWVSAKVPAPQRFTHQLDWCHLWEDEPR